MDIKHRLIVDFHENSRQYLSLVMRNTVFWKTSITFIRNSKQFSDVVVVVWKTQRFIWLNCVFVLVENKSDALVFIREFQTGWHDSQLSSELSVELRADIQHMILNNVMYPVLSSTHFVHLTWVELMVCWTYIKDALSPCIWNKQKLCASLLFRPFVYILHSCLLSLCNIALNQFADCVVGTSYECYKYIYVFLSFFPLLCAWFLVCIAFPMMCNICYDNSAS